MKEKSDYLLYLVSDSRFEGKISMYEQIEEALSNGVTMIQYREKNVSEEVFLKTAISLRELTNRYKIPLLINDNVDVAMKCSADGVHLGRSDMSIIEAREKLGKKVFIGSSVATVREALSAQDQGADYIGVGAMFTTKTKSDTRNVTPAILKEICNAVDIPAVAIGGINEKNIFDLEGCGVSGIAVVSAILAKKDIASATRNLRFNSEKLFL